MSNYRLRFGIVKKIDRHLQWTMKWRSFTLEEEAKVEFRFNLRVFGRSNSIRPLNGGPDWDATFSQHKTRRSDAF